MFEVGLESVCEEINGAFRTANYDRVEHLLWPALDQFQENPQLWFYAGNVFFQTGRPSLAAMCFTRCLDLDDNPLVASNLGASYRRLNDTEGGLAILRETIDRHPTFEPALVNYGAMYVNEGNPQAGIPSLEKACELGRAKGHLEKGAEWNLALLYLESKRFAEGFDLYRNGYGSERMVRTYSKDQAKEPKRLTPEDHAKTIAGAALGITPRPTLIVWGEQGIGDELMFASCLNDITYQYDVVFECHPRLEKLHQNSTWARRLREEGRPVRIYPTRKEKVIEWPVTQEVVSQFKCPVADLAALVRRDLESFRTAWNTFGPTYSCRADERDEYRHGLEQIAKGRKIVGLATHGGVLSTARSYRTLRIPEVEYLIENTDCLFVAFDYDDMTPMTLHLNQKYPGRYVWIPSIVQHWDYDKTASLLAATDLNALVCQSAAHLSAGIGANTRVLAPLRAAWREVPAPEMFPDAWYLWPGENIKLLTQKVAGEWKEVLDRLITDIKAL